MTAARIREVVASAVASAGAGTPGAELKANLAAAPATLPARVDAFLSKCAARDRIEFIDDVLAVLSARRTQARRLPILEFAETFPVDDLDVAASIHFDPETCTLRE
jgi:hypothetical protein